jgi:hypothetical protein
VILGLLFGPVFQVIISYFVEFFEGPLFIKTVCTRVEPVYVSKDTFKFLDLFFSDVIPDFIVRKTCPRVLALFEYTPTHCQDRKLCFLR